MHMRASSRCMRPRTAQRTRATAFTGHVATTLFCAACSIATRGSVAVEDANLGLATPMGARGHVQGGSATLSSVAGRGTPDPLGSDDFVRQWFVTDAEDEFLVNSSQVREGGFWHLAAHPSMQTLEQAFAFSLLHGSLSCVHTQSLCNWSRHRDSESHVLAREPPGTSHRSNRQSMHAQVALIMRCSQYGVQFGSTTKCTPNAIALLIVTYALFASSLTAAI